MPRDNYEWYVADEFSNRLVPLVGAEAEEHIKRISRLNTRLLNEASRTIKYMREIIDNVGKEKGNMLHMVLVKNEALSLTAMLMEQFLEEYEYYKDGLE